MFNKLFGPSIYLTVLDLFLKKQESMMNLREIARMVGKNPGSVSRVMPRLLEAGLVKQIRVGKKMYAYHLNKENETTKLIIEFHEKLRSCKKYKHN